MKLKFTQAVLVLTSVAFLGSCTTDPLTGESTFNQAGMGALIGGLAGGGIGALSGDNSRERRKRALIGGGLGALTGTAIGAYMDSQEQRFRQELSGTGVSITRKGDQLILSMPGNITFPTDSSDVNPNFYPILDAVGRILQDYPSTLIDVAGHTDDVGSDAYNLALSRSRGTSVADFITQRGGVDPTRVYVDGYGERYPIASNATPGGREQNRRVELSLQPLTN